MLAKTKPYGMDFRKASCTPQEKKHLEEYLQKLADEDIIELLETPTYYMVKSSKETLYTILYKLCRDFDIELI